MAVTIQLGQCGNQLGTHFFLDLASEYTLAKQKQNKINLNFCHKLQNDFFKIKKDDTLKARCVLIDMEPKVIDQSLSFAHSSGLFSYDINRTYSRHCGSANNWAFGYNKHGPESIDIIMEKIRHEVESCDLFEGFFMLHSLAGGTGSGLGAYLSQKLREYYEISNIFNIVVYPFSVGEVNVQHYNSLLTLSCLNEYSDMICVLQNDKFSKICTNILSINNPSVIDLNAKMSETITSAILPSYSANNVNISVLYDPIKHLCSHPGYKFTTIRRIPQVPNKSKTFNNLSWKYILKHLNQMQITNSFYEEGLNWRTDLPNDENINRKYSISKSLKSSLYIRGDEINNIDNTLIDRFKSRHIYPNWIYPYDPLKVYHSPISIFKDTKSATLFSTDSSILVPLEQCLNNGRMMLKENAYVHHYEAYSIEKENMEIMFNNMEQVYINYSFL